MTPPSKRAKPDAKPAAVTLSGDEKFNIAAAIIAGLPLSILPTFAANAVFALIPTWVSTWVGYTLASLLMVGGFALLFVPYRVVKVKFACDWLGVLMLNAGAVLIRIVWIKAPVVITDLSSIPGDGIPGVMIFVHRRTWSMIRALQR